MPTRENLGDNIVTVLSVLILVAGTFSVDPRNSQLQETEFENGVPSSFVWYQPQTKTVVQYRQNSLTENSSLNEGGALRTSMKKPDESKSYELEAVEHQRSEDFESIPPEWFNVFHNEPKQPEEFESKPAVVKEEFHQALHGSYLKRRPYPQGIHSSLIPLRFMPSQRKLDQQDHRGVSEIDEEDFEQLLEKIPSKPSRCPNNRDNPAGGEGNKDLPLIIVGVSLTVTAGICLLACIVTLLVLVCCIFWCCKVCRLNTDCCKSCCCERGNGYGCAQRWICGRQGDFDLSPSVSNGRNGSAFCTCSVGPSEVSDDEDLDDMTYLRGCLSGRRKLDLAQRKCLRRLSNRGDLF